METVKARLDIEVFVDCPICEYLIDLMRPDDTNGTDHNEEGQVIEQACSNGFWSEEHKKFELTNVTCSKCKCAFNVKGLEW